MKHVYCNIFIGNENTNFRLWMLFKTVGTRQLLLHKCYFNRLKLDFDILKNNFKNSKIMI